MFIQCIKDEMSVLDSASKVFKIDYEVTSVPQGLGIF